jgi:hypothetical protein
MNHGTKVEKDIADEVKAQPISTPRKARLNNLDKSVCNLQDYTIDTCYILILLGMIQLSKAFNQYE